MKREFQSFHPYLTYENEGKYFVQPDGTPSFEGWPSVSHPTEMYDDALDLWWLGKQAFDALGEIQSMDEFDELHQYYLEAIKGARLAMAERMINNPKSFEFSNREGESFELDLDDISNSQMVDILWQFASGKGGGAEDFNYLGGCFLFACLEEIDSTIIGMCIDGNYAVSGALAAAKAYANYEAIKSGNENLQKLRSEMGYKGALEKIRRDSNGKFAAKRLAKMLWDDWQANPGRYAKQTDFVSAVLDKVDVNDNGDPVISFDTVLKKWVPEWNREARELKK